MTDEPFRRKAIQVYRRLGRYEAMAAGCDHARSHAWWRNLVDNGAWGEKREHWLRTGRTARTRRDRRHRETVRNG
jgi:hypothetical protein